MTPMNTLKQHRSVSYPMVIGLGLIIVSLLSCASLQPEQSTHEAILPRVTPTPGAIAATARPVASMTPTLLASATSAPSPTSTPKPTLTPMATPTPLPSWTPLPTISPDRRGQVYTQLMADNGGCVLPCWWGMELGHSSSEEVVQQYSFLGALITVREFESGRSRITALFIDPQIENGTQVRHTFRAQDGIVIEAEVEVGIQANYQIEPLLQQLGQPSEVWMWTIPQLLEGVLPASLRLYFPENGVLIAYAIFAERRDDVVELCFDGKGSTILLTWIPRIWDKSGNKGLVDRARESSELTVEDFFPIDEMSNWDVERFYTVLSDPNHIECLKTPATLWPEP